MAPSIHSRAGARDHTFFAVSLSLSRRRPGNVADDGVTVRSAMVAGNGFLAGVGNGLLDCADAFGSGHSRARIRGPAGCGVGYDQRPAPGSARALPLEPVRERGNDAPIARAAVVPIGCPRQPSQAATNTARSLRQVERAARSVALATAPVSGPARRARLAGPPTAAARTRGATCGRSPA